jgi:hypothetical protein
VTTTNRLAIAAVLILVLGLAACSSSSKQAAPTTTAPAPSTTVTAPPIKGKLGPCPSIFPRVQLTTLNAGVPGVDTKLVPFVATSARVCVYGSKATLTGSGTLASSAAAKLATDTNALVKSPGPISCANQKITRLFFVSFDSTTQRVHLGESNACGGGVSNGTLIAKEAPAWTTEVMQSATRQGSPPVTAPK